MPEFSAAVDKPTALQPYPAPAVGWYATLVLAFLYWLSILDRFIISLLVDPIKRDMGISDVQFGLLHGFAFAITYALFGLLAGALADRFSRRWVIFISVSAWSIATAACGMAQNFLQLLLARVGVGAGEAGLNPSATSMLTDLFPPERLTTAMAVYSIGATIGSGTAYLFGGIIVDMVSKSASLVLPLVGEIRSWQAVFFIVGLPGALLSLLIFTLPEPVRRRRQKTVESAARPPLLQGLLGSYRTLWTFIRSQPRFFALHYTGFMFASAVIGGCGAWYPAHMARTFGWNATTIGFSLGTTLVIAGIVGKLICGTCVDAMYRRGYRDGQLRWYAICLLIGAPVGVVAMLTGNPTLFFVALAIYLVLLAPLPAVYTASLNLVTPGELRGAGIAFFAATAGLIGLGGGPLLIAFVSDHLLLGPPNIGQGMAVVTAVLCPISAVLLGLGCKHMREAAST
ncbi:MFS transporter [Haliea sp. E17]|uniref:MFS transporter n=1 Tax=Haliea sp. E17 TaxID=3401576 RepID=UPI003AAAE795